KPRTASSAPSTVRLRTRRPITAANSGSGCVSPNSDGTTVGSPWPTRAEGGLRKYAGSVGGRWAYCAIDLLLTATPMILEGFGEGGSHRTAAGSTTVSTTPSATLLLSAFSSS